MDLLQKENIIFDEERGHTECWLAGSWEIPKRVELFSSSASHQI